MVTRSEASAGFNAAIEISKIKSARSERRRKGREYRSKLDRYRSELVSLYHAGASYEDLSFWLKTTEQVKIHPTSIMRFLRKLPEFESKNG